MKYVEKEAYYKEFVNSTNDYEYLCAIHKGGTLLNGNIVKNSQSYIRVKHKVCGEIYDVRNDSFIRHGRRCAKCFKEWQRNQVKNELLYKLNNIENVTNGEFVGVCLEKKSGKTYLKVRHVECGNEYLTNYGRISKGIGCKKCSSSNKKSDAQIKEEYFDKFKKLNEHNYELIDVYRVPRKDECGNKVYLKVRHTVCDDVFDVESYSFLNAGTRCKKCAYENNKISHEEFLNRINNLNLNILPIDKYIRTDVKIRFKCLDDGCGHIWKSKPNSILGSRGCPMCNISKGERRVLNWLDFKNVKYVYNMEYFKDLLSVKKYPLRPDFILPEHKIWIEYDGEFHFKDIYGDGSYEMLKLNDSIKNKYAKKHGWKLIRIPYWEFDNIENILEENLLEEICLYMP